MKLTIEKLAYSFGFKDAQAAERYVHRLEKEIPHGQFVGPAGVVLPIPPAPPGHRIAIDIGDNPDVVNARQFPFEVKIVYVPIEEVPSS